MAHIRNSERTDAAAWGDRAVAAWEACHSISPEKGAGAFVYHVRRMRSNRRWMDAWFILLSDRITGSVHPMREKNLRFLN